MRQSFAKSIVVLVATLSTNHAFANTNMPTDRALSTFSVENGFIPITPRVSGWLLGGRYVLGAGDMMVPVFGNSNSMLFTDLQGKDGNNASVASLGAGFRQVVGNEHILGAYVFFDHNNFANTNPFPSNSTFWIASPGVELLGQAWDFHANGYVPISSQSIDIMTAPAQQFGINNYVEFTQHEQLDRVLSLRNNVGPGGDVEVGRTMPFSPAVRAFAGAYYFKPQNTDKILGAAARLEYAVNHNFAVALNDSYDNYMHNSFELVLRLTFGGIAEDHSGNNIADRMLDPIERNIGTLSQGTGVPVVKKLGFATPTEIARTGLPTDPADPGDVITRSNIYFFTNVGGSAFNIAIGNANCTFGNPCTAASLTQANVTTINTYSPSINFYLAPGTYALGGQISLPVNNAVFGRTQDYTQSEVANLTGGLALASNDTLNYLQIVNDGSQTIGLQLTGAQNVVLSNVTLGAQNAAQGYATAINMVNSGIFIDNSSVINAFGVNNGTLSANIVGVQASSSSIVINNSNIVASATGSDPNLASFAINESGDSVTQITNSTIQSLANNGPSFGINTTGIVNNNSLVIDNSEVISTSAVSGNAFGIVTTANNNSTTNLIALENSVLNVTATIPTATGGSNVVGISSFGGVNNITLSTSKMNITGSKTAVSNTGTMTVMGISTSGYSNNINLNNSNIAVDGESNGVSNSITSQGIFAQSTGTTNVITINGGLISATAIGGLSNTANAIYAVSPIVSSSINVSTGTTITTIAPNGNETPVVNVVTGVG